MKWIAHIVDTTEQWRAHAALARSEARFQRLSETELLGITFFELDGRVRDANDRFLAMVGYTRDELLAGNVRWNHLTAPEWMDRTRQALEEFRATGRIAPFEKQYLRKDGSRFWGLLGGARLDEGTGGLAYVLDISEQKRSQELIRESEERFRLMADASPAMIWMADEHQCRTWFNRSWIEFVGQDLDSQLGRGWTRSVHPDDLPRCLEIASAAFSARVPFEREFRLRRRDGQYRWVLDRGIPMHDPSGTFRGYIGSGIDITERTLRSEELERIVAERTARLRETVGELEAFSYSLSHDLRGPLRAMHGFASILLDEWRSRLDAEAIGYLERIVRAAHRLDRLIQDVLDYSRLSRKEIRAEPVDLNKLIADIIEQYPKLQLPKADVQVLAPLPKVAAHEAYLTQCFSNLLVNAVKFVDPGVFPQVRIGVERRSDCVHVWVQDNGIGIPPEDQERIFNIFERIHDANSFEGTGIGLSVARKAIERMNGRIGVDSQVGRGSRFWVELPPA